ncbi:hypothetical protein GCM10010525_32530 [Glutamicibacter bergerei]
MRSSFRAAATDIEFALAGAIDEAVAIEVTECTVADCPAAMAGPGRVPKESAAPSAMAVKIFGPKYLGI